MKLQKICKTCEYKTRKGDCLDGYEISDKKEYCDMWNANIEYLSEIRKNVPWYIKELYDFDKIDYRTFIKYVEDDENGKPIPINIYDLIEHVYNLSDIQLADILNVSLGVITYAKNRETVEKRVKSFSDILCIPEEYFKSSTSLDIREIEKCKEKFKTSIKNKNILKENINAIDKKTSMKLPPLEEVGVSY